MTTPKISIIIPAYNEAERLGPSLDKVLAYLREQQWQAEVLVVDDGSRDTTAALAAEYASRYPELRLLENPGNRGKGYSVRHGVLAARGEQILFSDADLSSPIQEAGKLLAQLEAGADVAIGSRWLERDLQTTPQPVMRQLAGRVYNILLRMILGLNFKDTQCGMKAFTRRAAGIVFTRQQIERWGFDPELLFIARKNRLRIVEVPVEWAHDERSKINPLLDGFKMGCEMLQIRWNGVRGLYRRPALSFESSPAGTK
jgi:glycosyltransferase involved in cell wall biosynthesis